MSSLIIGNFEILFLINFQKVGVFFFFFQKIIFNNFWEVDILFLIIFQKVDYFIFFKNKILLLINFWKVDILLFKKNFVSNSLGSQAYIYIYTLPKYVFGLNTFRINQLALLFPISQERIYKIEFQVLLEGFVSP